MKIKIIVNMVTKALTMEIEKSYVNEKHLSINA